MFAEGQVHTPDQMIGEVLANRMTSMNSRYQEHPAGWVVAKHEHVDQAWKEFQSFFDAIQQVAGSMKVGHVFIIPQQGLTSLDALKSRWLQGAFKNMSIPTSATIAEQT